MPIYEYVCQDCQRKFEVLRSFKDADQPINCKNCSSPQTHRVLSTCYSHGEQKTGSSSSGCGGCSGGSCSSCRG